MSSPRVSDLRVTAVLSHLDQVNTTRPSPSPSSRKDSSNFDEPQFAYADYLKRLSSYTPSSWFAKPRELSAPQCALWGWRCVGVDRLACDACLGELVGGSREDQQMTSASSRMLSAKHRSFCPWREIACPSLYTSIAAPLPFALAVAAERWRAEGGDAVGEETQRRLMASANHHFAQRAHNLSRLPLPLPCVSKRFLSQFESDLSSSSFPLLSPDVSTPASSMLWLCSKYLPSAPQSIPHAKLDELAQDPRFLFIIYALNGWNTVPETSDGEQTNSAFLRCDNCLAQVHLKEYLSPPNINQTDSSNEKESETEQTTKKRKRTAGRSFHPQREHRTFCPWSRTVIMSNDTKESKSVYEIPFSKWLSLPHYPGSVVQLVALYQEEQHKCSSSESSSSSSASSAPLTPRLTPELMRKVRSFLGNE